MVIVVYDQFQYKQSLILILIFDNSIVLISIKATKFYKINISEDKTYKHYQQSTTAMQSPTPNPGDIQLLLYQLSTSLDYTKADETYYAICDMTQIQKTQPSPDVIEQLNQIYRKKFSISVLGTELTELNPQFVKVQFQQAILWVKEAEVNGKLVRLVFFPMRMYQLDDENGPRSYNQMVMQLYLSNAFLKPQLIEKITVMSFTYMPKPTIGMGGRIQPLQLNTHISQTHKDLKEKFNFKRHQVSGKIVYVIVIDEKNQSIEFKGTIPKDYQINVLTTDEVEWPLYRLKNQGEQGSNSIVLEKQPTILLNHPIYIQIPECHLHFHYHQFLLYKPRLTKDNVLDKLVTDRLIDVIMPILTPIYQVKELIYSKYDLKTQAKETGNMKEAKKMSTIKSEVGSEASKTQAKESGMMEEAKKMSTIKSEVGSEASKTQAKESGNMKEAKEMWKMKNEVELERFNGVLGCKEWLEGVNGPRLMGQEEEEELQYKANKKLTPQQQVLSRYTQQFKLNSKFSNQPQHLVHAMIMDQINRIHSDFNLLYENIWKLSDIMAKLRQQGNLLQYLQIIIRFLGSLKRHPLFAQLLQHYQPQFYQHLLTIYLTAYDEFCRATNIVYGKVYHITEKLQTLKSTKKEIVKVIKGENTLAKGLNNRGEVSVEAIRTRVELLRIFLSLLEQNRSSDKTKELEVKVLEVKYGLGVMLGKLGILEDFGNQDNPLLKESLKLIFHDLYKHLFKDNNNFTTQYGTRLCFNQLDLLQHTSGTLKALGRIDLSIQIQKKQGNHAVIENYYNRWLMKYRSDMGEHDVNQIKKILLQAIAYFKAKFIEEKVQYYYGLLIRNCRSLEERARFDNERLDYVHEVSDLANRAKLQQKARQANYGFGDKIIEEIVKVYQQGKSKIH